MKRNKKVNLRMAFCINFDEQTVKFHKDSGIYTKISVSQAYRLWKNLEIAFKNKEILSKIHIYNSVGEEIDIKDE